MVSGLKSVDFALESRLRNAARGDAHALFDLGVSHSTGSGGVALDLIEAHKWFNLAAMSGLRAGQAARAEIADDMTAREVAEAQRRARAWLGETRARAA